MAPAALAAWAVAALLVTTGSLAAVSCSALATVLAALLWNRRSGRAILLAAICVAAVAASCAWRLATVEQSPLTDLARSDRLVTLEVEVSRDARPFTHQGRDSAAVQVTVRRIVTAGEDIRLRSRATAFVDGTADDLVVGRRLVLKGRLGPSASSDEAAVIDVVRRGPVDRAAWWWEASERVREGVRRSVSHLADEPRAL
ncbi:MAG: DUF4131 domain-containing protein, partial [Aeromicrobium sp.]